MLGMLVLASWGAAVGSAYVSTRLPARTDVFQAVSGLFLVAGCALLGTGLNAIH